MFTKRLMVHWINDLPRQLTGLTDNQLYELAAAAITEATEIGIDKEEDVVVWADLCLVSRTAFAQDLQSIRNQE